MEKVYRQGIVAKGLGLIVIAIAIWGIYDSILTKNLINLLWMSAGLIIMYRVVVFGFFGARLYITDIDIRIEYTNKGFRPSKELRWGEIARVADEHRLGGHVYHLLPVSSEKKRIKIPDSFANHWDLLREIVDRVPNAAVDESIIRALNKYNLKQKTLARP